MRVTLIAVQSLDGFITKHDEPGTAFASTADQIHFARTLQSFDCSVLGGETYRVSRERIRTHAAPTRRRMVLTRDPAQFISDAAPGVLEFTSEAPVELVRRLAASGHRECALLGGAQLHHLFLTARLVDRVWVTIEPRLFGNGTAFLSGPADVSLGLESVERLGGSDALLVKYLVG
jgi:dihydrofolate reductase